MNGIYRTYRKINMRPCKLWSVDLSGKISQNWVSNSFLDLKSFVANDWIISFYFC